MKKLILISLIGSLFLSSCTPARIVSDNFSEDTKTSKVVVYRENRLLFIGVPAIFGYDEKDKAKLWIKDRSEIRVPIGKHEFFVRSNQADRPLKLNVEIKDGKSTCFVINPEPEPVIKFFLFPLFWFSHAFKIEEREVREISVCQ